MIEPLATFVFVVGCAFLMGFSVNQGSTCAVTAAKELVHQRHGTMLSGFAIAVGTAGVICLPLSWYLGSAVHLAADSGLSWTLVLGAVLLGVGAVVNDACLFGTLSRIGHGEVRFLALPIGLGIGFWLANRQSVLVAAPAIPNHFAVPSVSGVAVVLGFAILLAAAWFWLGRGGQTHSVRDWPLRRAMVVLGLCGALLFLFAPGWTYADAVQRAVGPAGGNAMMGAMTGVGALIAAFAALAGALVSGIRARSFVLQLPSTITTLRSLIGGVIMAFGGTLIPGGNDTLLLSSVPAATVSGTAAYAVMSLTVPLLLLLLDRRSTANRY
jgi:uncharacterized protein